MRKMLLDEPENPKPSKKAPPPPVKRELGTTIVVLDRGFVYVGRVHVEGDMVTVTNARNIRKWGTTKGLSELVNGPTTNTVLDEVGEIAAPLRAVIHFIKCKRDW